MRRLVGAGGARAVCERNTCDEQVRGAAELLVDAVCVGRCERQVVSTCDFLALA